MFLSKAVFKETIRVELRHNWPYTVEPRYFEVPREMEKKFEIAGFRNNRRSVKFVTMNHFLIKYSTV